jgi:hypothetical protein
MLLEILKDLPVNHQTAHLILALAVDKINASPLDYRTRLRTYDEITAAVKDALKEHEQRFCENNPLVS